MGNFALLLFSTTQIGHYLLLPIYTVLHILPRRRPGCWRDRLSRSRRRISSLPNCLHFPHFVRDRDRRDAAAELNIPTWRCTDKVLVLNFPFCLSLQINLRLILVSGKTKEFMFSPSDSAGDIAQTVYDNWPDGE